MARLMSSPAFALWLQLYDRCSTKNHWFSAESAGCRRYKTKGTMLGPLQRNKKLLGAAKYSKNADSDLMLLPQVFHRFPQAGCVYIP
jgi:hypothetical protein